MKPTELERMPLDDLWALHLEISETLAAKLSTEKRMLEDRLSQLAMKSSPDVGAPKIERRPYPMVFPKFQNSEEPYETWAGRGKQPRWLMKQLKSGRQLDDFKIQEAAQ